MNQERLFKVLGKGQVPCHGGDGKWLEGEWREVEGPLKPCGNGLHLCREKDLITWLHEELWEAEYEGERMDGDDKVIVRRARITRRVETWNERTARLFACDCAAHVLPVYEKTYPDDKRPHEAIETARRYADGKATKKELDAARDAAENAIWSTEENDTWSAAKAAAKAAASKDAASEDATWTAAWDATWDVTWTSEREWQTARLMQYLYK